MTRRTLLLIVPAAAALAQPDTPKNRTADQANLFNRLFAHWAEAFNRIKTGTLDAGETAAFEPMPAQFRKLEHLRMNWIRGFKS